MLAKKKINKASVVILAGDATTVTKSGKSTFGVGMFFSSIYSKVIPAIAFQCISLIDIDTRKSYPIINEQILPIKKESKDVQVQKPKRGVGRPKLTG